MSSYFWTSSYFNTIKQCCPLSPIDIICPVLVNCYYNYDYFVAVVAVCLMIYTHTSAFMLACVSYWARLTVLGSFQFDYTAGQLTGGNEASLQSSQGCFISPRSILLTGLSSCSTTAHSSLNISTAVHVIYGR